MDKLKVLDLFSGIGGFSLGLERTGGFETAAFCEIDHFCKKVLKKHWPDVHIYNDVTNDFFEEDIDVVCGGFPCQPHSNASRGRKTAICLWPKMFDKIARHRPRYVIAENVQEKPIRKAENDLHALGYSTTIKRISAHEIGADHQRNRWWLIAHPNDNGKLQSTIDAKVAELQKSHKGVWGWKNYARAFRVSDGFSDRMDRLKSLGNAVLPQIPEIIGHAILAAEGATP